MGPFWTRIFGPRWARLGRGFPPLLSCPEERQAELLALVLEALATHKVGDRPGRCEPRRIKRRPKYPLLNKPRAEARAELLNN